MNVHYKTILKRAIREAVKLTKVDPEDTDKDVIGKIFNHFHQNLNTHTQESWELARKIPRRMKQFNNYSDEFTMYITKLLSSALVEVNKVSRNNELDSLRNSLYSMKAMVSEAEKVNQKSELVLNQLSEIERNINNV